MARARLIPIIYARVLAREAAGTPAKMRAVLAGSGVDEEGSGQHSGGMTITQYRTLLKNAVTVSGDDSIVFKAAANLAPTIHGPVGIAASASPTFLEALNVVSHYGCLRNPFGSMQVEASGKYVSLSVEIFEEVGDQIEPALDFMVSTIAGTLAGMSDVPLRDFHLNLKRQRPENYRTYEALTPCPIRYGQKTNSFVFRKSDLERELPSANQEVCREALERCNAIYSLQHTPADEIEAVYTQFVRMSGQICNIEKVADEMGMSARTLQRRLKKHGKTYQELLDQWLSQEAVKYLVDENLTVEVAAVLLGYGDEANFRRAFKRWFDVAPGVYRRQQGLVEIP